MNDINSLAHSKWNCKYHIVFVPKYRRKVFYGQKRLNKERIAEYIRTQLEKDRTMEQLCITEAIDPFEQKR